jgi:hypothetical protein
MIIADLSLAFSYHYPGLNNKNPFEEEARVLRDCVYRKFAT